MKALLEINLQPDDEKHIRYCIDSLRNYNYPWGLDNGNIVWTDDIRYRSSLCRCGIELKKSADKRHYSLIIYGNSLNSEEISYFKEALLSSSSGLEIIAVHYLSQPKSNQNELSSSL